MVKEERLYPKWNPAAAPDCSSEVGLQTGIIAGKLALNKMHKELAAQGFIQVSEAEQDDPRDRDRFRFPHTVFHWCSFCSSPITFSI